MSTHTTQLFWDMYSILYQRGIYPPETFTRVNKYGLSMLITSDPGLQSYLKQVLEQLSGMESAAEWTEKKNVKLTYIT